MKKSLLIVVVFGFLLAACAAPAAPAAPAAAAEEAAPAEEMEYPDSVEGMTFAICSKSTGGSWWTRFEQGILEYAEENNVNAFNCGPAKNDAAAQIGILDEIIAQGVDGLGNVPFGVEEHEAIHLKAMEAGIPVVLHEAPRATNADYDIEAFDNCEYGARMMDELAKMMGEEGTYVSFTGSLTNDTHMIWQECAYERQLEAYPNMTRLGLYESREDAELGYQIFKDLLKTNPEIKGMTGSSSGDVVFVGRVIQEAGLTGQIKTIGTTMASFAGEMLATGDVSMGMGWDPALAGKAMAKLLEKIILGEPIEEPLDLEVPGYEACTIKENENGLKIVTGNAWIIFTQDNYTDPTFYF